MRSACIEGQEFIWDRDGLHGLLHLCTLNMMCRLSFLTV